MSSKQSSLVKEVQRYWDMKTQLGKSMKKVAEWGDKHPASAVPDMLHRWSGLIAKADIGKARTFEIGFEERPAPAEKHCKLGNCLICGTSIRYGTRVSVLVNGRKLNFGEVGDLVGEECFDHMTYIAEAAGQKNFKMYEADNKQREKGYDKLAKLTLSLGDLAPKIVKKLEPKGFDLDDRILAEVADDVQKKASEGDFSAIKYETDKGKTRNMIGWALANKEKIYDPNVRYTVALLSQRPDLVKSDQWAAFILYQWQERPLKAAGEIGGIKEDILYLSQLPASHPVIKEYDSINLEKVVEPVKAFSKARWEDVKLGELLQRDAVTKAQSRAVKYSVPHLKERREYNNRETINSYCTPDEFNKTLVTLKEKVDVERKRFAAAKAKDIKEPDMPWKKDTWKSLRDFFELEERVQRTDNTVSTRDVFLNYVFMQNAQNAARTLYVEGKKVELAKQKGDDVLGRAYSTIRETKIDAEKLDKLVYGALDFDRMPRSMKRKIQAAGISARSVKKLIEDVKETHDAGLLPTKYIQPDKKGNLLERAVAITADFTPDDGSIAKDIGYLRQLETELDVKIANVRAEDGRTASRKSDARFSTKSYEGKKYFSEQQKKAVQNLMQMLPHELKTLDAEKMKETVAFVKKFHAENNVYNNISHNWRWGNSDHVEFKKAELPGPTGVSIAHLPFSWYAAEAQRVKEFDETRRWETGFTIVTDEIRKEMTALMSERGRKYHTYTLKIPDNREMEAILKDHKTVIGPELKRAIHEKYTSFMDFRAQYEKIDLELAMTNGDIENLTSRLEKLNERKISVVMPRNSYNHTPSVGEVIRELKDEQRLPDKNYLLKVGDTVRPERIVMSSLDVQTYDDPKNQYFDFIAESNAEDSKHQLAIAFGPKRNGRALMKWTPTELDIGTTRVAPGTWYAKNWEKKYVKNIIYRADEIGKVYIRIIDARK